MSKTVLVVDDDPDFLLQMRLQLEAAGYAVVTQDSARAAEAWLAGNRPDIVLTDLMMEEPDAGFRLCYRVKRQDATIPVLIVTAVTSTTGLSFDAETDEERAWVKADALLAKPVRMEQLLAEIRRMTESAAK